MLETAESIVFSSVQAISGERRAANIVTEGRIAFCVLCVYWNEYENSA